MIMKVFGCRNQENYGGGLILVAAASKEEAFKTASNSWMNYKINPSELILDVYPFNAWFETEHLSTNLIEPQVIIEDHYVE